MSENENDSLREINENKAEPEIIPLDEIYQGERGFTHDDWVNTSKIWSENDGDNTHRLEYDLNEYSIVFDVGGYLGKWATDMYCRYGCKIFVYEPISHYAHHLRNKFKSNKDVTILEYGLAHLSANSVMSIINEASSLIQSSEDRIPVTIVDVVEEIQNRDVDIDLMKINIEGAEYLLLEHLLNNKKELRRIKEFQIQFHIWTKNYESRREKIRELLQKSGYELTYNYPFIWENWKKKDA